MSNRRDFLRKSLAGAAAAIAAPTVLNSASSKPLPSSTRAVGSFKIGYQLYGIRDLLAADQEGTMKLVSQLGFEGVEYSGMTNTPAITFRLLQNRYNLPCCGIHYGLTDYLKTGLNPKMEYNYILGNNDVSCHWLDPPQRGTLENYLSHAEKFNEYAREYKKNGFNFYYHNHAYEFTEVFNGKYAMDVMLENTDPALMSMEFHFSGLPAALDIIKYIEKLGGRLTKLHFPVLDQDGKVELRQDIIDAAKASGSCKWFIIEQNYPDIPATIDRLSRSVDVLRDMLNK